MKEFSRNILHGLITGILGVGLLFGTVDETNAQTPPEFELSEIFSVNEQLETFPFTAEANLALNMDTSEMLVTFYDTGNTENDPITGDPNQWALLGVFLNPETFELISDPFVIMGNPNGEFETHETVISDHSPAAVSDWMLR